MDTSMLKLTFAISLKNENALNEILTKVSDPKSEYYGEYMTMEEVHALTSKPESADALMNWLAEQGVASEASPGKDFVLAMLSAADAKNIFGVEDMVSFVHETTGEVIHRSKSLDHTVPDVIVEHVDFINGLYELPSTLIGKPVATAREVTWDSFAAPMTDAPSTPQTIMETYKISQATKIADGNTMSVIEALGQQYSEDDCSNFAKQFGVPYNKVDKIVGNNDGDVCKSNPNNCAEASLDVQYMMAVAQNVPMTYWSIDASDQTPFLDWIVAVSNSKNPPLVHSVSYGEVENAAVGMQQDSMKRINTEFQKVGVRGLTVTVASGDDGVANFQARQSKSYCGFNPSFPASSPYVLAVGATQFKGGSASASEIGQSKSNSPSGGITTGGGFSSLFDRVSYQDDVVNAYLAGDSVPDVPRTASTYPSQGFNAAGRGYPDVAALGHAYPVSLGGNFYQLDGTSASSPVVAGMLALINNERLLNGKKPLGFVNPLVYSIAAEHADAFNDVVEGENKCCAGSAFQGICCDEGFAATKGWDPVSGLGTFNFDKFLEYAA
jgi:tripeptidyl-peptidase-1